MQNLEPILDFQVFNLITRADIVSVQSLLAPCGIADVCFRIRCNWRTGLVPGINEQTAPIPKSRDKYWDFGGCLKSMVL
jgi:hypothetical protein